MNDIYIKIIEEEIRKLCGKAYLDIDESDDLLEINYDTYKEWFKSGDYNNFIKLEKYDKLLDILGTNTIVHRVIKFLWGYSKFIKLFRDCYINFKGEIESNDGLFTTSTLKNGSQQ